MWRGEGSGQLHLRPGNLLSLYLSAACPATAPPVRRGLAQGECGESVQAPGRHAGSARLALLLSCSAVEPQAQCMFHPIPASQGWAALARGRRLVSPVACCWPLRQAAA